MTRYKIIILIKRLEDAKHKTLKNRKTSKNVIQTKYEIKVLPLKYLLNGTIYVLNENALT